MQDEVRSSKSSLEAFGPYELYMLGLSVFSILVLAADTLLPLPSGIKEVLVYTDSGLCVLFLADFIRCLRKAPNRWRYLTRSGWLDILSSIPTIDALRLGRLSRIARIVRMLRAMRSARTIHAIIAAHRQKSALLATAFIAMLLVVSASIAVLQVETGPNVNITTGGEALWWAFATITTVGYGDYYPVTFSGRLVAAVLMAAGLGLAGTLAGVAASWFLGSSQSETEASEALTRELSEIRAVLKATLQKERSGMR